MSMSSSASMESMVCLVLLLPSLAERVDLRKLDDLVRPKGSFVRLSSIEGGIISGWVSCVGARSGLLVCHIYGIRKDMRSLEGCLQLAVNKSEGRHNIGVQPTTRIKKLET